MNHFLFATGNYFIQEMILFQKKKGSGQLPFRNQFLSLSFGASWALACICLSSSFV